MANDNSRIDVLIGTSLKAAVALDAGLAVVVDGNGNAALPGSAGVQIAGITVRGAAAGETVEICQLGLVPVVIGTASGFTAFERGAAGTNGKINEAASTNTSQLRILAAAGANNNRISAFVNVFDPVVIP